MLAQRRVALPQPDPAEVPSHRRLLRRCAACQAARLGLAVACGEGSNSGLDWFTPLPPRSRRLGEKGGTVCWEGSEGEADNAWPAGRHTRGGSACRCLQAAAPRAASARAFATWVQHPPSTIAQIMGRQGCSVICRSLTSPICRRKAGTVRGGEDTGPCTERAAPAPAGKFADLAPRWPSDRPNQGSGSQRVKPEQSVGLPSWGQAALT